MVSFPMKNHKVRIFISGIYFALAFSGANAQDSLTLKGQLSAYANLNKESGLPFRVGGRYIPQLNYTHKLPGKRLLDFEASLNISGSGGFQPFDSSDFRGNLKPYRLWARYSSNQYELRAGLQKINFGSASLLRPLMWFDQIDPRDPLSLTDGVWGVLSRYYFLNNANIWLWGLMGNKNLKGWESLNTKKNSPEFGGRFQIPVPKGEAALSYHHRIADGRSMPDSLSAFGNIPENRFGFDAKFDMTIGWWVEGSWSNFNKEAGDYRNQEIANIGLDYTFGIGNGLTAIYEQLIASSGAEAFNFSNPMIFSLLSASYPVGMFDNVSAIVYFDWKNKKAYNFLNWQKQFNKITLYLMGYLNPKEYNIPAISTGENLYAGSGVQLMLVYNH